MHRCVILDHNTPNMKTAMLRENRAQLELHLCKTMLKQLAQ